MTVSKRRRALPHLRRDGATYFVTWRLDRNQPLLGKGDRHTVFGMLRRYEPLHWRLNAAVVMDDHVHVIVTPAPGRSITLIVQAWKATSSSALRQFGRAAPIWQRGYHDRIVRPSEFEQTIRYVASNPRTRWPALVDYPWLFVES